MVTPEDIKRYIEDSWPVQHVEVTGDGQHFEAVIVSQPFAARSRVQRHQLVYGALGDRMREEIHALSMQTLTPGEWAERARAANGQAADPRRRAAVAAKFASPAPRTPRCRSCAPRS